MLLRQAQTDWEVLGASIRVAGREQFGEITAASCRGLGVLFIKSSFT